jgi:hypothetical protein
VQSNYTKHNQCIEEKELFRIIVIGLVCRAERSMMQELISPTAKLEECVNMLAMFYFSGATLFSKSKRRVTLAAVFYKSI